jgi:dihydroneopterin aldolase / 2-amino-4-hydroxy-6-hydroxymethyldihydropteridine diphosphokinase
MPLVYIGLGSNLGNRKVNIKKACEELLSSGDIEILKESLIEETVPVDYLNQPLFLNQIILIKTEMPPAKLLKVLKSVEKKLGREKTISKGPRIIDLDILLYDDIIFNSRKLAVPHPEIKNRNFILKHLIAIDPYLTDPLSGILYADIYKREAKLLKDS